MARSTFSSVSLSKAAIMLALSAAGLMAQPANTILLERWDGIGGTLVSDLTSNASYPDNPTARSYPTLYEMATNTADNYGTRTRGYITPPTTGNYTFWIASDDNSELWLGTSSDPASARQIASVPAWTNSREWTKYSQQQSAVIALTGGTRYYIETRQKEGSGGDNLAVGWQGPGITGEAERPIPGSRLSPFVLTAPVPKTILAERWDGISGTSVTDLTSNSNYPNNPTARSYAALYELAGNIGDNYGTRTRGYVTPPTTGNYTFWISSDDNSELWLGTSNDPATARRIASVSSYTNSREWTKLAEQQSASIALNGGTSYYIETRHKEGSGGDNLAVGWQGPGITGDAERPIPGARLAPFLLGSAPVITVQPVQQVVNEGQPATFSVTATGAAPLTYQWFRSGTLIPGANAASYTTPPTTADDYMQQYSVVVSNAFGSVTSLAPVLIVNMLPFVTLQPVDQTVALGQTANFQVNYRGMSPLTFQWRRNGANISGATADNYTTPPATAADNGAAFSVVLTNPLGTATSSNGILRVNLPPTITAQPVSQLVAIGQTATFSVTVSGTAPFTYQWRKNGANISGATGSSYTTPPATSADGGSFFSVVISNAAGTATSSNAFLNLTAAPVITTQPSAATVNLGLTATFNVVATGTAPLTYQWRKNGANINGATGASYITPPVTASDNGALFSVVVSNSTGTATSNNAVLTVITPAAITTQPVSQTVNLGQTATFSVTATGTAPLAYQWRKNGTIIGGATAASYTAPAAVASDNGALFSVVVSNPGGSVTSSDAILTVISVTPNARKIAVSGELVDAAGNPVGYPAPITVDAIVRLYNDSLAGSLLYSEDFRAVAGKGVRVTNGLFVVRLGEGVSSQNLQQIVTANPNLWVEVTIDDGTLDVLRPRTPLTSSPYSLGGTPAAALAAALSGNGDPNLLGVVGEVGATYVNSDDNSTWFKLKSTWKRLD